LKLLSAASWMFKWVAGVSSIECVGAMFVITGALILLVFDNDF